ncbi:MAG TPA: host nuclease inhibitor protein [Sphingomonas sp.]|nr:host nuclease inhibitor protein [Sphingomonas sp.]
MAALGYAYAWRSGMIETGPAVPDGAIPIARGGLKRLSRLIDATARHAYDGATLLVPGVPEADSDDAALDALLAYRDWIGGRR